MFKLFSKKSGITTYKKTISTKDDTKKEFLKSKPQEALTEANFLELESMFSNHKSLFRADKSLSKQDGIVSKKPRGTAVLTGTKGHIVPWKPGSEPLAIDMPNGTKGYIVPWKPGGQPLEIGIMTDAKGYIVP